MFMLFLEESGPYPMRFSYVFKFSYAAINLRIFRARDRPFLSLWLVVCLILNAAYQSKLVGDLTFQTSADAFENVADFYQSDFKIRIPKDHFDAIIEYIKVTPRDVPLLGMFIAVIGDAWDFMRPAEKIAYLCNVEDLRIFLPSYRIIPDTAFSVEASYFILLKPTPLEDLFIKSALRIFDVGAFAFMERGNPRGLLNRKEWKEKAVAIDLPGLSAVFLLWLCGCFLAFFVFSIEVVKVKLCCESMKEERSTLMVKGCKCCAVRVYCVFQKS